MANLPSISITDFIAAVDAKDKTGAAKAALDATAFRAMWDGIGIVGELHLRQFLDYVESYASPSPEFTAELINDLARHFKKAGKEPAADYAAKALQLLVIKLKAFPGACDDVIDAEDTLSRRRNEYAIVRRDPEQKARAEILLAAIPSYETLLASACADLRSLNENFLGGTKNAEVKKTLRAAGQVPPAGGRKR